MKKQKIRKAVVTDGGYATRFFPVTKTLPKCMLPLIDKPIAHYVIEECMAAGIKEVIIVATDEGKPFYDDYFHNTVQHIYEQLRKQGKEERFNKIRQVFSLPNIIVITQDKNLPYGNGTPALCAKPYIGDEPFLYIYADDVIIGEPACKELIKAYEESEDDVAGIIAVKDLPHEDVSKYSAVKIKKGTKDHLEQIVEKPTRQNAPSTLISFGRYLFTPRIYDYLKPTKEHFGIDGELWTTGAIDRMAKENVILIKPISGKWRTTGDPINHIKTVLEMGLLSPDYNGIFIQEIKGLLKKFEKSSPTTNTNY